VLKSWFFITSHDIPHFSEWVDCT